MRRLPLILLAWLFGLSLVARFVSADAQYVRRSTGGSGNATVPNDAPIQPPQAFVDATSELFSNIGSNTGGGPVDWSDLGITAIDPTFIESWLSLQNINAGAGGFNLSGNALPVANINSILAVASDSGVSGSFTLNLSGGTNAAPTLPVFVIDFNNLGVTEDNIYGSVANESGPMMYLPINGGVLASGTTVDFSGTGAFIIIGADDSPTKQQIINKLVALGGGKIVDNGNLTITVSPANYDLEPLDFTGMTGSSLTQGNNDIATLRANGWTVTTNLILGPELMWALSLLFGKRHRREAKAERIRYIHEALKAAIK